MSPSITCIRHTAARHHKIRNYRTDMKGNFDLNILSQSQVPMNKKIEYHSQGRNHDLKVFVAIAFIVFNLRVILYTTGYVMYNKFQF